MPASRRVSPTTSRSKALVRDRARMVDIVLRSAWQLHVGAHANDVDLIAVGGYGRGELHPCSDIDVLILLPKSEVVDGRSRASSAS